LSAQEADRENHNPDSQNDEQSFPESLSFFFCGHDPIPSWRAMHGVRDRPDDANEN
jgi:hypothetical protein